MTAWSPLTLQLVVAACDEDLGSRGDITSALLPDPTAPVTARLVARQAGVLCGLAIGATVCQLFAQRLAAPLTFSPASAGGSPLHDGDAIAAGTLLATLRGPHAAVLSVERTLLNFISRQAGVATLTRRYVDAAHAANPHVQILDTRKTLPGWRELDKYAVRAGGGTSHRAGLYDAVLVKDNHLAGIPLRDLATVLTARLQGLAALAPPPAFVEVEVDSLAQLREIARVPPVNLILLDNFSLAELRAAVDLRNELGLRPRLALEASGGVTLDTLAAIAATGVERISVGALTHSAPGLDVGLDL